MLYYLYRHIRLDTGNPFYIGIGKKQQYLHSYRREYARAYSKKGRNRLWMVIVKSYGYHIEILYETDNHNEIQTKEIEFISLYGRLQNGGILVNLTDGGDGCRNLKTSEETKQKLRYANLGKITPAHVIEKIRKSNTGKKRTVEMLQKQSEYMLEKVKTEHPAEKINNETAIKIINLYNDGIAFSYLLKQFGICYKSLENLLSGKGRRHLFHLVQTPYVVKKHIKEDEIDIDILIKEYNNGKRCVQISNEYCIDRKRISKLLKKHGIKIKIHRDRDLYEPHLSRAVKTA